MLSLILGSLRSYRRRQLQRKRQIKIELCVWLDLQLLKVGHVVQKRRTTLLFAWHEWFLCKGKE